MISINLSKYYTEKKRVIRRHKSKDRKYEQKKKNKTTKLHKKPG